MFVRHYRRHIEPHLQRRLRKYHFQSTSQVPIKIADNRYITTSSVSPFPSTQSQAQVNTSPLLGLRRTSTSASTSHNQRYLHSTLLGRPFHSSPTPSQDAIETKSSNEDNILGWPIPTWKTLTVPFRKAVLEYNATIKLLELAIQPSQESTPLASAIIELPTDISDTLTTSQEVNKAQGVLKLNAFLTSSQQFYRLHERLAFPSPTDLRLLHQATELRIHALSAIQQHLDAASLNHLEWAVVAEAIKCELFLLARVAYK